MSGHTLLFQDYQERKTYNSIDKCETCGAKMLWVEGLYETIYGNRIELGVDVCQKCHPYDYLIAAWEGLGDALFDGDKEQAVHWHGILLSHNLSIYDLVPEQEGEK